MSNDAQAERGETPLADPATAVRLRGDPPVVMRLSRKAIGITSASALAVVGGALIYALQPASDKAAEELYNTTSIAVADNLAGAPKDYGQVPKLGPPLPGDLGKPILDAQRRGDIAELPPIGAAPPVLRWCGAGQCGRRGSRTSTVGRSARCRGCGRAADRSCAQAGVP